VLKPTTEILERMEKNSKDHPEGVHTRLYRYLLREDIYYSAYQKLYANKGAATRGTDNDTADGFGKKYVDTLITELENGTYQPKPMRREYIRKANGKMRPLGIPSFRDKLLQEVVRRFLEAIYEPQFNDCSHGFRPERSCHTALKQARCYFVGAKWFIEGDIKGCFDNIDHAVLIGILERKIKDSRFINIIRAFLKAGYIEDWRYNQTHSGTPQGGILSPILANIYLNELDTKVMEIKARFEKPREKAVTTEYRRLKSRIDRLEIKAKTATGEEKAAIVKEISLLKKQRLSIPCTHDSDKNIAYIRYADDFLLAVKGNREDCIAIKAELAEYLQTELKLTLSEEKTLITHSAEKVRFLGYDVSIRRSAEVRTDSIGRKSRSKNGTVELAVPLEKVERFMFDKGVIKQTASKEFHPVHRGGWLYMTDYEILERYNSEIRGILNYYQLAANYNKLNYFCYLMEYSCLATLTGKYSSTISKVRDKYAQGKEWSVKYKTSSGVSREKKIVKPADCRNSGECVDEIVRHIPTKKFTNNSIRERLLAEKCELCGKHGESLFEIHHVASLKELSGTRVWEAVMQKMRRKTLVVCEDCHAAIHGE
jgi:group II intron reverse transcriptase/maturase